MQRKKPEVDVVLQILQASLEAQPSSSFLQSLLFQYQERGGLSKKQLEGLHAKAKKKSPSSGSQTCHAGSRDPQTPQPLQIGKAGACASLFER